MRGKTAAEGGRISSAVSTHRKASRRALTRTTQAWRERPLLVAGAIADRDKTRGRSRHGCTSDRCASQATTNGRHRTPPGFARCNCAVSNDLPFTGDAHLSSARRRRQSNGDAPEGEHPARVAVPLPVPPEGNSGRANQGREMKVLTRQLMTLQTAFVTRDRFSKTRRHGNINDSVAIQEPGPA